jgi:hypothetical protein
MVTLQRCIFERRSDAAALDEAQRARITEILKRCPVRLTMDRGSAVETLRAATTLRSPNRRYTSERLDGIPVDE